MAEQRARALARRVSAGTVVTVLGVVPAFLAGALGVVLRPALGLSAIQLGALVAVFWGSAALVAVPAGVAMRRLSGRGAMVLASIATAAGGVVVASAGSVVAFGVGMALAGAASALCQLAAAKYLSAVVDGRRIGLALGVKQAALPAATLVGGLAVPLAVGRVPWPALYLGLALTAAAVGLLLWPRGGSLLASRAALVRRPEPRGARGTAVLFAVVAGLASVGATGMSVFLVEFVDGRTGVATMGGLLLAAGSALAVAARVAMGAAVDGGRVAPAPAIATMLAGGAVAALVLTRPLGIAGIALAVAVLYGVGWGWSGLVVYTVVRSAGDDVAAATGTMQTGVWLGSVLGPLVLGAVIDHSGYAGAWAVVAACFGVSSLLLACAPRRLRGALPQVSEEIDDLDEFLPRQG